MRYRLPIGAEITPYSTHDGLTGTSALTTVVVEFDESEVLQRVTRFVNQVEQEYICLSLGENPSKYDSYLLSISDLEVIEE